MIVNNINFTLSHIFRNDHPLSLGYVAVTVVCCNWNASTRTMWSSADCTEAPEISCSSFSRSNPLRTTWYMSRTRELMLSVKNVYCNTSWIYWWQMRIFLPVICFKSNVGHQIMVFQKCSLYLLHIIKYQLSRSFWFAICPYINVAIFIEWVWSPI